MARPERLKYERERKDYTLDQVAQFIGTSRQNIYKYESGIVTNIPSDKIELLANLYDVSPEYLMGWSDNRKGSSREPSTTDFSEQAHIKKYRALDERGKRVVDAVLDAYADAPVVKMKVIPLLGTRPAAGPGEMDTGLPWEDYEIPAENPGEFAVQISGDSMEPVLHDGQIVLCAKRTPEIGDVTVISVNGSLLVKQFITDGRNIYLRSLNRARKDADLDIWESGSDTVRCYGTVILPKRPRLVDE